MKTRILLACFLAAHFASGGAAQELLPSSEKTRYVGVCVSPGKNEIIAIARARMGESSVPGVMPVVTFLHFFDRNAKAKFELTPAKGHAYEGDFCDVHSITFSPDGRRFLAGGWGFFAGWKNPSREPVFFHKGVPDEYLETLEVNQLAASRKDSRIAQVCTRRVDGGSGPSEECKLTLWGIGVSKDEVQAVRTKGRYDAAGIAKLVASISRDGGFLACYDTDAKKLTVHDASKIDIKQHAVFELKLPDVAMFPGHPAIVFSHDNSVLWVLCKEKLYVFDLKTKKQGATVEFEVEPFWIHALADGSSLLIGEIDHDKKKKSTVLNLFDPKSQKSQGQINLGKVVAPLAISPDDALLAGAGDTGIYLWNLPELLAKTRKK